jgi:hypothetical protein
MSITQQSNKIKMGNEHGGFRPGAGRKPGSKNKVQALTEEQAKAYGLTPMDFMLQVVNDEKEDMRFRGQMAASAAPYCHRRLAQIEHTGNAGGITVQILNIIDAGPDQLAAARAAAQGRAAESVDTARLPDAAVEISSEGRQAGDRDSPPPLGEG